MTTSTPCPAKDHHNFALWKQVFPMLEEVSKGEIKLDDDTIQISDGANLSMIPQVYVQGIVQLPDGKLVTVKFDLQTSWNEIKNVTYE